MVPTYRSLRVLVVFEYGTLNGGENSLLALVEPLRALQIEIVALAPPNSPLTTRLQSVGVPTRPLVIPRGGPPDDAKLTETLRQTIADFDVDLVHSNSLSMSRRVGRIRSELPIRCLAHLRDIIGLSKKAIADINRNDRILAVSAATRSFHVGQGLDADRCAVVYNGVDLDQFRPDVDSSVRAELNIAKDVVLLTAIGQIGIRKGLDTLLEAMKLVCQTRDDVHLLIVGQRFSEKAEAIDYEARLRQIANQTPLVSRVHFCGFQADIPVLLSASDMLVHASRQEPLGRVLLEGAACGLAIIASDVGGTHEIFPSDSQAVLFPDNATADLASAITTLADDASLRQQYGVQARLRAEAAFSHHRAASSLAKQYRLVDEH